MQTNNSVDLLDVLLVFLKNKIRFLTTVIIITILGLITALLWPKTYKSELIFVANQSNSLNMTSGGLLSGLANLSVTSQELSVDQILVLFRSTDILDLVIDEFNLQKIYGTDIKEALRVNLLSNVGISEFREGGLGFNSVIATNISVTDKDPIRAYEMLKFYFDKVDSVAVAKNKSNLEKSFGLLQTRLDENLKDLKLTEDSLLAFQNRYGIIQIDEQSKALIQNIAKVKSNIINLEIELGIASKMYGEGSASLETIKMQLDESRTKYDELIGIESSEDFSFDVHKPLSSIPNISLEYLRRFRDFSVQQEVYQILYPQYEQQKLNYEEISSGLLLLQSPKIPTYKNSPKRAYIVLASFIFGVLFSSIWLFFREWKIKIKENDIEAFKKYNKVKSELKF